MRILSPRLLLFAALGLSLAAHATPVITFEGTVIVPEGGVAPGSASNYDFFGGPQPVNLTNFTVQTFYSQFPGFPGNPGYSSITAPGGTTPFVTGTQYNNSNPATVILATFTPTFSGDFSVYILNGNADVSPFVVDSTIGLALNGSPAVNSTASNTVKTNAFSIYNVQGATAGQVFNIYVTGLNNQSESNVAGVTFGALYVSPSSTPEPSSFLLLGTGVLGVAGTLRRRLKLNR